MPPIPKPLLRAYASPELGPDGYPVVWHQAIKDLIRLQADHRCVRCGHPYKSGLRIQTKVRLDQVYPWEHSAWFQPYVAGFYAWVYLRQDISRTEVMARLPKLLALEGPPK